MPKPKLPFQVSLNTRLIPWILSIVILALSSLFLSIQRLQQLSHHFPLSLVLSRPFSHSTAAMSYSEELYIASLAVQRATILTQKVFYEKAKGTLSKDDKSPVTIGDFGAQALIIKAIKHNFPEDEIVGEEEASSLRDNATLSAQIWQLVKNTRLSDELAESELGGALSNQEEMLQAIDSGNSAGGAKGRIWALDPIDGTLGFLRGGQYAVCLALIVDGDVKVGVLGCPNLPVDGKAPLSAEITESGSDQNTKGVLFAATVGEGASSRPLGQGALGTSKSIQMNNPPLKDAKFCESVEASHSSHSDQAQIAEKLGISQPSVRMDSQAKYGSIARGAGDVYLRLPVRADYQEKIWDHAAGDLIVREAQGMVTDANGNRLDFGQGRILSKNKGVVAAPKQSHETVLKAVKSVLAAKQTPM